MKLASFIAVLALAQSIQVYNNGTRVGEARPVIDCRGSNTCTISGGSVRITGDGGSGSGGVDGGTCTLGTVVTAINTMGVPTCEAPNRWVTAFDFDYQDAGAMGLSSSLGLSNIHDGGTSVAGYTAYSWQPVNGEDGGCLSPSIHIFRLKGEYQP